MQVVFSKKTYYEAHADCQGQSGGSWELFKTESSTVMAEVEATLTNMKDYTEYYFIGITKHSHANPDGK